MTFQSRVLRQAATDLHYSGITPITPPPHPTSPPPQLLANWIENQSRPTWRCKLCSGRRLWSILQRAGKQALLPNALYFKSRRNKWFTFHTEGVVGFPVFCNSIKVSIFSSRSSNTFLLFYAVCTFEQVQSIPHMLFNKK